MHNRTLELKLGIVDNDPLVLDLLTHYFVASHAPLHVLWSLNNPKQAWRVCNDERTRPQVVLTDIEMPGMNGRELFHRIRAHEPNIVVIGISAFPDAVNRWDPPSAGQQTIGDSQLHAPELPAAS